MASLLCVTYPQAEALPRIEEEISTFAEELTRVCDSVTRCELAIEKSPQGASRGGTWSVRATLHLFGDSIGIVRFQPDLPYGNALRIALRDIVTQASHELSAIARDHTGCACTDRPHTAACKGAADIPAEC